MNGSLMSGVCSFCLKAIHLHNGNKYPDIPLVHVIHMKELYDNMKLLLEKSNRTTLNRISVPDVKYSRKSHIAAL